MEDTLPIQSKKHSPMSQRAISESRDWVPLSESDQQDDVEGWLNMPDVGAERLDRP